MGYYGDDARLYFPATERNREAIGAVLEPLLPAAGLVFPAGSSWVTDATCVAGAIGVVGVTDQFPDPSAVARPTSTPSTRTMTTAPGSDVPMNVGVVVGSAAAR